MSNLLDFLTFLRPWDDGGNVAISFGFWTKDQLDRMGFASRRVKSLSEAEAMIRSLSNQRDFVTGTVKNVYFSSQSYTDAALDLGKANRDGTVKIRRKAMYVTTQYNFWCDLDVKPGNPDTYQSVQEAGDAIYAFSRAVGLPDPSYLVGSGNGMQVYWRIDGAMSQREWQITADALKNAMIHHKIKADHAITADAARVLRAPDTTNTKPIKNDAGTIIGWNVKPAFVIPGGSRLLTPYDQFSAPLRGFMGPHLVTVAGQRVGPAPAGGVNQALTSGVSSSKPVDLRDAATQCGVLGMQLGVHGAGAPEPLWNLVALACAFDQTPWKTFEAMSDGYSGYDPAAAQRKLAEKDLAKQGGTGWPSCSQFHAVQGVSSLCPSCPHFAAGKSPLHLRSKPQAAPGATPGGNAPNLPSPQYYQGIDGKVYTDIPDPTWKGVNPPNISVVVIDYPVGQGWIDHETEELVFLARLGNMGERHIRVPINTHRSADICGVLVAQRLIVQERGYKRVGDFLMSWVSHLQSLEEKQTFVSAKPGWGDDGSFTFGDSVWRNGVATKATYRDLSIIGNYGIKGDAQVWKDCVSFVRAQHAPWLESLIAAGFGAPLVELSGVPAILISPYSGKTASGKSTTMKITQAIWGHPVAGQSGYNDTSNKIMKMVADLRHLPVVWDEVRGDDTLKRVVEVAFTLGQGKDKGRLKADVRAHEVQVFSTMMIACSNYSLLQLVIDETRQTNAGAARVFELQMPLIDQSIRPTADERTTIELLVKRLNGNYGHAGRAYAEWLSSNKEFAAASVRKIKTWVDGQLGGGAEYRIWSWAIACILGGARFAQLAGIVSLDVSGMGKYLIEQAQRGRMFAVERIYDADDPERLSAIMESLLREQEHIFTTDHLSKVGGNQVVGILANDEIERIKRLRNVWGQYAQVPNEIRVVKAEFEAWLKKRGLDSRAVLAGLLAIKCMTEGRSQVGAGVGGSVLKHLSSGRSRTLDISLSTVAAAAQNKAAQP